MANPVNVTANAVNVMDMVDSRSLEITSAMEALKTNMSVSYRLSIPFYMRRRAASHNPKRIPARVRPSGMEKSKSKFKWKQERRKREQEGKAVRLETHVWHAKRCHMSDVWGYRLALSSTQKGERAAYRAVVNSTTIRDSSYYMWFSLSADCLHSKLSGIFVPNHFVTSRVLHSLLYHKTECLGPVSVLWVSDSRVFVRAHPAIPHTTDLAAVFDQLSFQSHANALSQYTLDGVKAMELLVKSVNLSEQTNETVAELWSGLSENPFLYDIMKGTVLGCHVKVPPSQFIPFKSVTDTPITQPMHRLTPNASLGGDTLFRSLQYPEDTMDCGDSAAESLPCCVYRDPHTRSINVIIPQGTGTRFWIPLVYNGGRLIGLRDAHSLNTDRNVLTFPHDYPDTPAGVKYLETVGAQTEAKEMRRPPQKRVNYTDLGIQCPFVSNWSILCGTDQVSVIRNPRLLNKLQTLPSSYDNHFVSVSLTCVKRGNIKPGAHLYITTDPSPTDPIYKPEETYSLAGYVTSAKYCLATGSGGAVGLVLLSGFRRLVGDVLLVRNTTTKQYRHVSVSLIGS